MMAWCPTADRGLRAGHAPGIDGQTMALYEQDLETNLESLLDRAKSGSYRAPSVRRVNIPKGDGTQVRPIGIPTVEDKILQRAVQMVLEPIYEQEFDDCSYGFRPNRSAHDDKWFASIVQPRLKGEARLIRYADDFVILFTLESDARRVMTVLPKRFGKYGLRLHPERRAWCLFEGPEQTVQRRRRLEVSIS